MVQRPMEKIRKKDHLIFLFFVITFSSFISVASAGAPPMDNRPGYLLLNLYPPYINQSIGGSVEFLNEN